MKRRQRIHGERPRWPDDYAWAKRPGPNPPAADPLDGPILLTDPPDVQAEKRRRIHERYDAMVRRMREART